MSFTIDTPRGVVHEKFDFLGFPTRRVAELDRLRETRNTFKIVVN
jgi:hypothetical protein